MGVLTSLPSGVLNEEGGDIFIHTHFILGNAGICPGVFVANAADVEFASIGCRGESAQGGTLRGNILSCALPTTFSGSLKSLELKT